VLEMYSDVATSGLGDLGLVGEFLAVTNHFQ
jgi:hypothetical protein